MPPLVIVLPSALFEPPLFVSVNITVSPDQIQSQTTHLTMECLVDGLEGSSYVASNCELRTLETSDDKVLVKFVNDKTCPNGDSFSGQVNAITGELISGKRMCVATRQFKQYVTGCLCGCSSFSYIYYISKICSI
jgi:hypothetical protein